MVMMITASEARAVLPDLLSRVEGGEEVTITRHGRPVAVLLSPGALHRRRAGAALGGAEAVHQILAEAASGTTPEGPGLTEARAEELIAEIRAGRDAR
jgi:prevent-host-death family protein